MNYKIRRPNDDESSPNYPNNNTQESWERNTLRDVLLEAYHEQKRTRLWRNIWRGVGVPTPNRDPQRTHRRH